MTVKILHGDCRDLLDTLVPRYFHCCVTSPPYWGLRSYLPAGHPDKAKEIGSEPTVYDWVNTMVDVFRKVRRVLRDDGTLWVNFGDSYAGSRCGGNTGQGTSTLNGKQTDHSRQARNTHQAFTGNHKDASAGAKLIQRTSRNVGGGSQSEHLLVPRSDVLVPGLKPKDLVGQPWRAALAMQAGFSRCDACGLELRSDLWPVWQGRRVCLTCERGGRRSTVLQSEPGWYLRQDIIWGKRSPMPESARDRFTKAHEYVFLFAKSERYFFDHDAIQEPCSEGTHPRRAYKTPDGWDTSTGEGGHGTIHKDGREKGKVSEGVGRREGPPGNPAENSAGRVPSGWATGTDRKHHEVEGRYSAARDEANNGAYADGKSTRLGRKAGWRNSGVGFGRGTDAEARNRERVKDNPSFHAAMSDSPPTRNPRSVRWLSSEPFKGAHYATYPTALIEPFIKAGCPVGGTVLDPFGGSGTTGVEADRQGKHAVLIDLDLRNVPMAEKRLADDVCSPKRQLALPMEAVA